MKKKTKHGGKRKGAGRPEAGTVRLECRVLPATAAALAARAANGVTRGQVLDKMFAG